MRRLARIALASIAIAAITTGCHTAPTRPTVNFFLAAGEEAPRRVLVLPFEQYGGLTTGSPEVRDVFLSELMKGGYFDVVKPPPSSELTTLQGQRIRIQGTFDTDELLALAERFHADAVLIATITDYRPYPPLRLGLRSELISTRSGAVLWSADATFDAHDQATRRRLVEYHDETVASTGSLLDWEVLLVSMERFTRFGCHSVVQTLSREEVEEPRTARASE